MSDFQFSISCTALKPVIFSLELVPNIVSCPSTNKPINKLTGSIWFDEIGKFEDLCLISTLVDCFGSAGNVSGKLLSFLNALLLLFLSSVV